MQEVDREDLRELLASQSCSQDQSASTGIKIVKKIQLKKMEQNCFKNILYLNLLIIYFSVLQWTKIQKMFSSQPGPTHF